MKKLVLVLIVLLLITGCGNKNSSSKNNATITVSPLSFEYDASSWKQIEASLPSIILLSEADTDNASNITIQLVSKRSSKLTNDDLQYLLDNLLPYQTIGSSEMITIDNRKCIKLDVTTKITASTIDELILSGTFTQQDVDDAGGKEVLTSIPAVSAIQIYAVKNDYLIFFNGTYYSERTKDKVLEAIENLLCTCE